MTSSLQFPENFLWGAATAAHQVEGNNVSSDWWAREHAAGTPIAEPSGDAADSFHRYGTEMALLAQAGLNAYRFSLEWARIEPEPDQISRAALDHYRSMIERCQLNGLEPVVTLHHFTVPQWFAAAGGWRAADALDRFARYCETVLPLLSDGVRWVCTINEPNILAILSRSADEPFPAVGLPAPDPEVTDVLIAAHARARSVLSSLDRLDVGWTVATQAVAAAPGCADQADAYRTSREDAFLTAARQDDWVGVQAYTRTIIGPDGPLPLAESTETTLTGWEYYPPALGEGVRNAWRLAPGVPVLVTENGIATADDDRRIDYTRGALQGLHAAISDGVDVRGYLHWSALDNYEWGSFRPTFGLISFDPLTFARTPKESLGWLGRVAKANALPA